MMRLPWRTGAEDVRSPPAQVAPRLTSFVKEGVRIALGDDDEMVDRSRKSTLKHIGRLVLLAGLAATAPALSGCAVSKDDVHRWEGTERGPEKLVAVVTHDKYALELRTEAALSLIRMKPRNGKRIGIDMMLHALEGLDEESRKKIVNGMVPELVKNIEAPAPARTPEGAVPPDPSIPYKDATFGMLSHEPPLATDEKAKADLVAALIKWVQTDFEARIENSAQAYGVEQMARFLGAPAVKGLPPLMNDNSTKIDRIAGLIADIGDAETKTKGGEKLVALAKLIDSPAWIEKQKGLVNEANKKAGNTVSPEALQKQLTIFQDQELTKVFAAMKRIGGRAVVEYCLVYSANKQNSEDRRKASLAALEGRIEKGNTADIDKIFEIAKDESTPDSIRSLAFNRLGELPKEQVVPKLYTLFDNKRWKVRWVAAELVLKTMTTKGLPDFMRKLPASAITKMGMSEPITYAGVIQKMEAPKGEPSPKDAIAPYLGARELGPKLVALAFYYGGKKSDLSVIQSYESDRTPVPKCETDDQCGWSCDVPKAGAAPGSNETETKTIGTVGEFVKYCVEPSLTDK